MSTAPKLQNAEVLDAELRARNYWFADGLFNILGGIGCLLYAASFEIGKERSVLNLVTAACWCLIMLRRDQILEWLKGRITYPRTGFVPNPYKRHEGRIELRIDDPAPETPPDVRRARRNRTLRTLPGIAVIGVAMALLVEVKTPWICLVAAVLTGFAFCSMRQLPARQSLIILLGMPFAGLAMSVLRVGVPQRADAFMVGAGAVFLIDGTVTLIRYLFRNPVVRA